MLFCNVKVMVYLFLYDMCQDSYFFVFLVEQGWQILLCLCECIECELFVDVVVLCVLIYVVMFEFNVFGEVFEVQGSELEFVVCDNIGSDVDFIVCSYGFDVDVEDLISLCEW